MENILLKNKKYTLLILITLLTAGFVASNASASITPDTVTRTLYPGDCYTVIKNVTIPDYTPTADVMFSFWCNVSYGLSRLL